MRNIYVRLGLPVLVVCAVAAGGLSVTYAFTADRIAQQAREAEQRSLAKAMPDAASFAAIKDEAVLAKARSAAGEVTVDGLFAAKDTGGATVGMGMLVGSRGYGGPIRMAVGLDRNGKVVGVTIISMNETPGLGTKVVDDPTFLPKFTGLDSPDKAKKLDTITGATKSSRGVRNGVQAALAVYEALGGAEGGGTK